MNKPDDHNRSIHELLDRDIVIDTQGPTVIIGRLVRIAEDGYVLEDADVHDRAEGHSGKELYTITAAKFGVRINRRKTYIPRHQAVAISALEDIVTD